MQPAEKNAQSHNDRAFSLSKTLFIPSTVPLIGFTAPTQMQSHQSHDRKLASRPSLLDLSTLILIYSAFCAVKQERNAPQKRGTFCGHLTKKIKVYIFSQVYFQNVEILPTGKDDKMISKRTDSPSLAEQLILGRERIEKKKKMLDNIYNALIRGRDRLEQTDYKLPETKSE